MIASIDHVNLRTPDVHETARFFEHALGMSIMPSPGSDDPDMALWICDADGRAVVHLAHQSIPYPWETDAVPAAAMGSGRVHHVAFRCSGYEAMRARLAVEADRVHENHVPAAGLRQLFVTDPNGIILELNFFGD